MALSLSRSVHCYVQGLAHRGAGEGREGWAPRPPVHCSLCIGWAPGYSDTVPSVAVTRSCSHCNRKGGREGQCHPVWGLCPPFTEPLIPDTLRAPPLAPHLTWTLSFLTPHDIPSAQTVTPLYLTQVHTSFRQPVPDLLVCKCIHTSCQLECKHL